MVFAYAALVAAISVKGQPQAADPPTIGGGPADAVFTQEIVPLLQQYCVDCHATGGAEAGIELDGIVSSQDAAMAGKTWLQVFDVIDAQTMPPADAEQPSEQQRKTLAEWTTKSWVHQVANGSSPSVVIRRLNRSEYENTIRDLIGENLQIGSSFPADDIAFGYDNIGSALKLSPIHIERYLDAAESITQQAIAAPDVADFAPAELIGLRTYPLPPDGQVTFEHHLEPGRYLVEFSLVRAGISENQQPPTLRIGFGTDQRDVMAAHVQDETVMYRFWIHVVAEDAEVTVALSPEQKDLEPQDASVGSNVSGDQRYGENRGLHVDSMVVRGPVTNEAWTAQSGQVESHSRLLFRQPTPGAGDRLTCGQSVVERFVQRAFRREISPDDMAGPLRIFEVAIDHGESYERAVQIALSAVMVSPKFLFLVEPGGEPNRRLSDYELASRLSYFLWSSMPDSELLELAANGDLRSQLRKQVTRMLTDPKSQAFVENFIGQWLLLRNLASMVPDEELFPEFDDRLRASMQLETEYFFADILKSNGNILRLLDASYSFVDPSLAEHYGMDIPEGDGGFQRVELADGRRGGLLTHASVLTLTSNHNRTSPVKRGQWVLQQLLGTPPPPPPPDVALLDESPQAAQSASLRERLQAHRASPECASCHTQMDALGFALENFDPIGRWREADGEFEIDASGELLGDRSFSDVRELKQVLTETEARKFSWTLIANMLTYGLGRGLEPSDYQRVESIRQSLSEKDYAIQEIVFAIVESDAFQRTGALPQQVVVSK